MSKATSSAEGGGLPDFLVIGAYKSGTTSLHHWLRAHPQLYLPVLKEPSYFAFSGGTRDDHPAAKASIRTEALYRALFRERRNEIAAGEVSPAYLAVSGSATRIAADVPDARCIALLRNPIDRAYSDYLMYVRDGRDPLEFEDALGEQEERRAHGLPTGYYDVTGFYGRQLQEYVRVFPKDQLCVVLYEDVIGPRPVGLHRIMDFLGVDASLAPPSLDQHNISGVPAGGMSRQLLRARRRLGPLARNVVPRSIATRVDASLQGRLQRPPIPEAARRTLASLYEEDLTLLEGLLDRDLSTWREGL